MSEALVEMFRHNTWANLQLFDACNALSDAQLDAGLEGTFGTIRDTLLHIVGAQERYAAALAGTGPVSVIREREPFPGLADLREAARASSEALAEHAARARDGALVTATYRGEQHTLPVWLFLVQSINHATEHRAQIAAIMTQQGVQPPSMDGWTYHASLRS